MQKPFYSSFSQKFTIILSSFALCSICGCGGGAMEIETPWSSEPIKIDGESEDWSSTPVSYFEEKDVTLGLCNDNDNLYVLFNFRNESWARIIKRHGVTIWFDTAGGKRKDMGIRFIGGPAPAEMESDRGGFLKQLTPEEREVIILGLEKMEDQLIIIEDEQERVIPPDGSCGPAVSSANNQGVFTYEFSIPLQEGEENSDYYYLNEEPEHTISIGLEWGLSEDEFRSTMERMRPGEGPGEGFPGGMEGPPGGGPPRGGQGRLPGVRGGMLEKQEVWIRTSLAYPTAEQSGQGTETK